MTNIACAPAVRTQQTGVQMPITTSAAIIADTISIDVKYATGGGFNKPGVAARRDPATHNRNRKRPAPAAPEGKLEKSLCTNLTYSVSVSGRRSKRVAFV